MKMAQIGETMEGPGRTVGAVPPPADPKEVGQPLADPHRTGKSPAFQFYPKDFLSDANVLAMSLTEIGAYWKLTCICWNEGSLPADMRSIARLLGVPHGHAVKLWPAVEPCFRVKDDRLVHPRLETERRKQAEYRRKQADNGRKGGRPSGKPVGSSGLTHTEATKSSSSSSAVSNLQIASSRERGAPLHSSHKRHAVCGRVCVPDFLHSEFVQRRGNETELDSFYLAVLREWSVDGPRAGDEPGDPVAFWRGQYEVKWPAAMRPRPLNGKIAPGDAWRPEGQ